MKISDQLNAAKAVIDRWSAGYGGVCKIAGDKSQLVGLLSAKPGAPRVVLVYIGEIPRGNEGADDESRVDRTFWAILSRGRGLKADPGTSLTEGTAGGPPMFDLVEELRDQVRTLQLDPESVERTVYFKGIQPFEDDNLPNSDAYIIEYALGSDIGMVTGDPNL